MAQLPKLASRPAVFQEELRNTLASISRMEARVRELTTKYPVPATPLPGGAVPVGPAAQDAAGARQVRVRDPKTGRTGTATLRQGESLPQGLEEIK
jgi:hypothetical protein